MRLRCLDWMGPRGLRPASLPYHRTCGFPHPAVEPAVVSISLLPPPPRSRQGVTDKGSVVSEQINRNFWTRGQSRVLSLFTRVAHMDKGSVPRIIAFYTGCPHDKGSVPRIIAFCTGCPHCPPQSLRKFRVPFPRDPRHRHRCAPPQFSGQKHLVGRPSRRPDLLNKSTASSI